ncbi:hypothetical protein BH09MYX1_BH09MYX1_18070 [soil metagenome]
MRALSNLFALPALGAVLVLTSGCGGSALAQPFESLKSSNITMYRQQNFEPPAAQAQQPGSFQIPPQILQLGTSLAASVPQLATLMNAIPGAQPAAAQPDAQRFHDFRILGWVPVTDTSMRTELLDILGHASNFTTPKENCMYAELGVSIAQPNAQPPADLLISLSCNQVRTFGFAWPYGNATGLTGDASKRITQLMSKAFAGGH